MAKSNVPMYRITISAHELSSVIHDLSIAKAKGIIEPDSDKFLAKLNMKAVEFRLGLSGPAYVNTGRSNASVDLMNALSDNSNSNNSNVIAPDYVGIERRDTNNYTPEQIMDAEFLAGDHLIATGIKKDWKEFIHLVIAKSIESNDINIETERRNSELNKNSDISDNALFESLKGL